MYASFGSVNMTLKVALEYSSVNYTFSTRNYDKITLVNLGMFILYPDTLKYQFTP